MRSSPNRLLAGMLAALALASPAAAAGGFRLAAFGDSLMDGYGLPNGGGFIPRMQEELAGMGLAVEVTDHAVSGDTTSDGLLRVSQVIASAPDGVLLALGSNDALRAINPAATRENLDDMLSEFGRAGVPVMLVGAQAPLNWGPQYKNSFDRIFTDLAERHGVDLYPFILDGVALVPSLNQDDGLHPNSEGIGVMVGLMAPSVASFVESAGGP